MPRRVRVVRGLLVAAAAGAVVAGGPCLLPDLEEALRINPYFSPP